MGVDVLHTIHIGLILILISIPFWSIPYLKWGIYIPLLIAAIWVLFDGCPITKIQSNLGNDTFMQHLYKKINPSTTRNQSEHVNCFILLLITVIGFHRIIYK